MPSAVAPATGCPGDHALSIGRHVLGSCADYPGARR
jgi:hypothetical protein